MAAATALLLLAGCNGGGGDDSAEPLGSTTTAPPVAGCPATALPPTATDSNTVGGEFDGDGRPDRLQTYRVGPAGAWRARVELGAGGAVEAELPAGAGGVRPVGGARLDPTPAETALAVVASEPAGPTIGLFVVRSCRLERVTAGGRPAEFPIRSAGAARSGLACQAPGLVAYQAISADGRSFQATAVGYLLIGNVLDEANRSSSTLGPDDPLLPRHGAFSCGGLRL